MPTLSTDTFGAVTVVCTSRTGPLTGHATRVAEIRTARSTYHVTGEGFSPAGTFLSGGREVTPRLQPDLWTALEIAAATSEADAILTREGWKPRGDPRDAALRVAARKAGIERAELLRRRPQIEERAHTVERGYMATFHLDMLGGIVTACVKGHPLRVLEMCDVVEIDGRQELLSEDQRAAFLSASRLMSTCGRRVVALAHGPVARLRGRDPSGLAFVALVGLVDPPAAEAAAAIETLHDAGVRTVLLTGDQREAAVTLAADVGLEHGAALAVDGRELRGMADDDLRARLERVNIFSRVTPEAIRRVVYGLRERGEVVAVVGTPVMEASALRLNDPVTAGPATLDAVVRAVRAGRVRIDNARKLTFYVVSCGLAGTLLFAGLRSAGVPMAWGQALWLAVLTSLVPALALTAEPAQPDVMRRPPVTLRGALLSPAFAREVLLYAGFIGAAAVLAMLWSRAAAVPPARAATIAFMTLGFAQLLHLGNARDVAPVVKPARALANAAALAAVAVVAALQVLTVAAEPLRVALHLEALTFADWSIVLAASALPAVAGQAIKAFRRGGERRRMSVRWRTQRS